LLWLTGYVWALQEREMAEQRNRELQSKQRTIEDLQRALQAFTTQREDLKKALDVKESLVQSQATQITQLTTAREKLQQQVAELEAALTDVDTRRQMELLRTQHEQVMLIATRVVSGVQPQQLGCARRSLQPPALETLLQAAGTSSGEDCL
jgi:uncharacterized protein (DUF3084 family)